MDQEKLKQIRREASRRFRERHPERVKELVLATRNKRKEYYDEQARQWYEDNKEQCLKRNAEYREHHAKEKLAQTKAYYYKNKNTLLEYNKKWRAANKHKTRAYWERRRAQSIRAMPTWANQTAIEDINKQAIQQTEETGVLHVVDHIVPLVSKYVCGLHCEQNMQVMDHKQNMIKGNKWWPDMWE